MNYSRYSHAIKIFIAAMSFCSIIHSATLSCRLEGMSLDDGPIRPHPTGERVEINVSPSTATLWSNQEYMRLSKLDEILPSGSNMHVYVNNSALMNREVDLVKVVYQKNSSTIFFQTVNKMNGNSNMSVYGRCYRK